MSTLGFLITIIGGLLVVACLAALALGVWIGKGK